jgi:predicted  nucleic acid-binding Zn-ribbon protein
MYRCSRCGSAILVCEPGALYACVFCGFRAYAHILTRQEADAERVKVRAAVRRSWRSLLWGGLPDVKREQAYAPDPEQTEMVLSV